MKKKGFFYTSEKFSFLGVSDILSTEEKVLKCSKTLSNGHCYYHFIFGFLGSYLTKASWYKTEKIQNECSPVRHQQHDLKRHYRGIEVGSTRQCGRSYVVNAVPGESSESESPKNIWDSVKNSIDAFYRFSRPHTIIGTVKSDINLKKFRMLFILPHR